MTIRQLPVAPAGRPCARVTCETLPSALDRWDGGIKAAATDDNSISVFDVIGQDYWGEGITAKRIAGALRAMNGADVTVNINSPGGDMFEGTAIYNLLREYEGHVTVKVLGIAASAASIIAMAGDDIQIGRGAFLMIHNCWVYAMGNRHDFAELAQSLEPFDTAMADIYAARSGLDIAAVQKLMDGESYIGGSDAVAKGLADSLLSADAVIDGDESPELRFANLMHCWPRPTPHALSAENSLKPYQVACPALSPPTTVRRALPKISNLKPSIHLKALLRR